MSEILELADTLGKLISQDPRAQALTKAQAGLDGSPSDRTILSDYQNQQQKLAQLEMQGKPLEPEDKRKLAEMHEKVIGSSVIQEVIKTQADYLELMSTVSNHIESSALGKS